MIIKTRQLAHSDVYAVLSSCESGNLKIYFDQREAVCIMLFGTNSAFMGSANSFLQELP